MKDLRNKTLQFENQLKTTMSKTSSSNHAVEAIKNILFNNRAEIYSAIDEAKKADEKIKTLEEINAALSKALSDADNTKDPQKKSKPVKSADGDHKVVTGDVVGV